MGGSGCGLLGGESSQASSSISPLILLAQTLQYPSRVILMTPQDTMPWIRISLQCLKHSLLELVFLGPGFVKPPRCCPKTGQLVEASHRLVQSKRVYVSGSLTDRDSIVGSRSRKKGRLDVLHHSQRRLLSSTGTFLVTKVVALCMGQQNIPKPTSAPSTSGMQRVQRRPWPGSTQPPKD